MAQSAIIQDPRAFGLAAHLALESLFDRLVALGIVTPNDVQIVLLEAMSKCAVHQIPASPWQAVASDANVILNKVKTDAQSTHGP